MNVVSPLSQAAYGQYTDQSLDTQVDLSVDNLREQKHFKSSISVLFVVICRFISNTP